MDRDDYFPEFYLGVVYLNTNRVGAALVQFQLARKNDVNTRTRRVPSTERSRIARALDPRGGGAEGARRKRPTRRRSSRRFMDRAQRAFSEGRFDDAESAAKQARDLNVDNAAADALVQNIERSRGHRAAAAGAGKSPSLAELRRLRTEYEGKGVSVDEVIRLIAAGEAVEARARGERSGMIEFFAATIRRRSRPRRGRKGGAAVAARPLLSRLQPRLAGDARQERSARINCATARRSYAAAAEQADQFKNDLRLISPRLIQLLKGS